MSVNMAVKVGAVSLKNPVIAASGTFGYGREYADQMEVGNLGGLVTKGVSMEPREGNPPPRICETACGMLNSIGLANVGLKRFIQEKLPYLAGLDTAVMVNLYGETYSEFAALAAGLEGLAGIAALEVNVSCPNVEGGGMTFGADPKAVAAVTRAVKENTSLPVWVKLTPNVTDPAAMAKAAAYAGADGVCLINTILGMAIDARARRPRLGNVKGGLSGPAIKPVGLRMVFDAARAVDIPVVGMGGIVCGEDAAEYLLAGASAVQVGTANFLDPGMSPRIVQELEGFCQEQGIADVNELVGALEI